MDTDLSARLAILSRLRLTPTEEVGLRATFADILGYIGRLVQTPIRRVAERVLRDDLMSGRPDVATMSSPQLRERLLKAVPDRVHDLVRVGHQVVRRS